jgi:hypothetical protein
VVPVIRINLDFFSLKIFPADGIRLPFSGSGDLGTSPFLGSSRSRQSTRPCVKVPFLWRTRKTERNADSRPITRATMMPRYGKSLPDIFAAREAAIGPQRRCRPATVAAAFWGTAGAAITIG